MFANFDPVFLYFCHECRVLEKKFESKGFWKKIENRRGFGFYCRFWIESQSGNCWFWLRRGVLSEEMLKGMEKVFLFQPFISYIPPLSRHCLVPTILRLQTVTVKLVECHLYHQLLSVTNKELWYLPSVSLYCFQWCVCREHWCLLFYLNAEHKHDLNTADSTRVCWHQ